MYFIAKPKIMGTRVILNDTLKITAEQWFPTDQLNYEVHKNTPYKAEDFEGKIFEFHDKEELRSYQAPPVRNFLVEYVNGKWLYWGLIHILEIKLDFVNKTTSGKYKIIYINTPEEMKHAHRLIDRNVNTDFFNQY